MPHTVRRVEEEVYMAEKEPKSRSRQARPAKKAKQASISVNPKKSSFKFRNLKYYLSETLRGFVRNKIMTLTSIATVAACLIIVVFSYAVAQNVGGILAYLETSIGITVFIDDELNDLQVDMLYQNITALDNVVSAEFISPDEALQNLADDLGDTTGILIDMLGDSPLRRSFVLDVHDIRYQAETSAAIWGMHGVANISEASALTDMIITTNNFVSIFSAIVILILGVLAVIIITNTIKLTVNRRRNEIIIMKYIGATDWFIKWPFVIEGVLIGIFGAIIPIVIVWMSYDGIIGSIRESQLMWWLPFRSASEIFPFFTPITIVLGAAIGILGSISSMRKYLSV